MRSAYVLRLDAPSPVETKSACELRTLDHTAGGTKPCPLPVAGREEDGRRVCREHRAMLRIDRINEEMADE